MVQYFGKLFGRHFSHVTQSDHLTGKHNGHLTECIVLFADEAQLQEPVKGTQYFLPLGASE